MNREQERSAEIVTSLRFCKSDECGKQCPRYDDTATCGDRCARELAGEAADLIESLRRENEALNRCALMRDGVVVPDGEHETITFCGVPIADAVEIIESHKRERDNPQPLTGPVTIGQVVTGKIIAADAERGLVSIKWDFVEPFKTPETPELCTLRLSKVKDGTGDAERGADWCNGYQTSEDNDEPCRICQGCKLCAANDPDDLDKAQEARADAKV